MNYDCGYLSQPDQFLSVQISYPMVCNQCQEAKVHKIMTTTHRTATTTDKTVTTTQKMGASMKLDARAVIAVGLKWESTQEMIGIDSVT